MILWYQVGFLFALDLTKGLKKSVTDSDYQTYSIDIDKVLVSQCYLKSST